MSTPDHFSEAERELARADWIANRDTWTGDRAVDVANAIAAAQVHATLSVAQALHETTLSVATVYP